MVGDHQVGGPGLVPRLLDEARAAVRAALRAQALPDRDRDLLPGALGVRGASSRSARPPSPACSSAHSRSASTSAPSTDSGVASGAALIVADQVVRRDQRRLVLGGAVAHLEQAGVVGPALEDRVPRPLAGDRFDRVEGGRDVVGGQLALQGQRRGGDHDPLVRLLRPAGPGPAPGSPSDLPVPVPAWTSRCRPEANASTRPRRPSRPGRAAPDRRWPSTASASTSRCAHRRLGRPPASRVGHRSTLVPDTDSRRLRARRRARTGASSPARSG